MGGYIILYAEHPANLDFYNGELPYNAPFNYIVGLCDKDGNLLESYDTGQPVLADYFGIYKMGFHLAGDELIITGKGREDGFGMQGIFNLKTHTYQNTLPQKETQ